MSPSSCSDRRATAIPSRSPERIDAMFGYYIQLGLRSLRRNPVLTLLMVLKPF